MTNNQWKCGIIYEKIAMRAGYDERMINYEWPCSDTIFTATVNRTNPKSQILSDII